MQARPREEAVSSREGGGEREARRLPPSVWRPFVAAALGIAVLGGFGYGGALFALVPLGVPLGPWWRGAAQAHGHAQLFGWLGLMVLGVALHFLPRLRGAPLWRAGLAPLVLALVVLGVVGRLLVLPAIGAGVGGDVELALRALLIALAVAELAGALLALGLLIGTLGHGPSLDERAGLRSVLPFFAVAFVALPASLAVDTAGAVRTALDGERWLPAWATLLANDAAIGLFVVPVCVGMSARTFPLFVRTPPPRLGLLRLGLGGLLVGVVLRQTDAAPVGAALEALALVGFALGLGALGPVRPLPRDPAPYPPDPARLCAQSACGWLLVAALILVAAALGPLGLPFPVPPSLDAERHALGAGFATLLVFGVGPHLLSAFMGRRAFPRRHVWVTLWLGNAAAAARVLPLLFTLPGPLGYPLLAAAGLLGAGAVAVFGVGLLAKE